MGHYLVDVYSWERSLLAKSEGDFQVGDRVVVETDFGSDAGYVAAAEVETKDESKYNILRRVTDRDVEAIDKNEAKRDEIFHTCKQEVKRLGLELKLVEVRITLDGSNVIVAFTADGRIDFRELVKNLSRIFRRGIRMQQIGSREEARKIGGCGVCGKELCCVKFPGSLPSITTEMARAQQIAHRGSERISGLCGRLMCCLAYEADQYREMLVGMPELHSSVRTKEGKGQVIEINALEQSVKVRLENNQIVTIKREELK